MKVLVYKNHLQLVTEVSAEILKLLDGANGPFGVATGATFEPIYKILAQKWKPVSGQLVIGLDEYLELPDGHPSSFRETLLRELVIPVGLQRENLMMPPNTDSQELIDQFEFELQSVGPVDLQLLGIGTNGHIAFNEPGSEKESRTRKVQLSEETLVANSKNFEGSMPRFAITQGIATIMQARKILLVATGKSKAIALKKMFEKDHSPASYLLDHPDLKIFVDQEAASMIPNQYTQSKD
jgi:glucosamine-6-phosphate deaminase